MTKKELWLKLKAYRFDHIIPPYSWAYIIEAFGGSDASTKAFASKVARKSGWTTGFALKAITEYKKFVYLAVVSDFNVTPSKVIDQVWHEHLLFSKGYRQFCTDIIEYTLDHIPELVPMEDQTGTFNVQYMDTINLYKTEFGIDPPAEIWSVPKFDQSKVTAQGYESTEKRRKRSSTNNTGYDDAALISFFGGGGASGGWNDHSSDIDSPGDSSGDSGGSSGCSSGCGGGGGGGD